MPRVDIFGSQNPINYSRFFLFSSFVCLLKCTEICTFQMRQNKMSQVDFSLSFSPFRLLSWVFFSFSKHQTFPANRHKINSSLKMEVHHHSQNHTTQTKVSSKDSPGQNNFLDINQIILTDERIEKWDLH